MKPNTPPSLLTLSLAVLSPLLLAAPLSAAGASPSSTLWKKHVVYEGAKSFINSALPNDWNGDGKMDLIASFDKQVIRNYLEEQVAAGEWDKTPPGPRLPDAVIERSLERYLQAYRMLTEQDLSV